MLLAVVRMQMGYSNKLIYSYKSQLSAGEDHKNMGIKDRDIILETESREGMR